MGLMFHLEDHLEAPSLGCGLFLLWKVAFGGILIMDNLKKQHVIVIDQCCMRKKSGEKIAYSLETIELTVVQLILYLSFLISSTDVTHIPAIGPQTIIPLSTSNSLR